MSNTSITDASFKFLDCTLVRVIFKNIPPPAYGKSGGKEHRRCLHTF